MVRIASLIAASLACAAALFPLQAQSTPPTGPQTQSKDLPPLNSADEAIRQARIAITGDLGFAPLPPVTADSPNDSMFYVDRLPHGDNGGMIQATLSGFTIPANQTGTGFAEIIEFQLPDNYSGVGTPHPMVIAYHGYGGSASSPANLSTIDEEANARGWAYLSVTGLDDQLFGSPISQQNTEAGIQWMLDSFNVDPDRLYMVGFSAGGGIVTNFAARRRDPDGIMIAAVGTVSATTDWVLEYNLASPGLQDWMKNSFNFGGTPGAKLFQYQQASATYSFENSYPPAWGAIENSTYSMSTNLADVPMYITYDTQDTITHVPHMGDQLASLVLLAGGTVQKTIVTGTTIPGPPSVPSPHSWAVLDEVELFDFFDGKSVERYPQEFTAQQDLGGDISWASTVQDRLEKFTFIEGEVVPVSQRINVTELNNTTDLFIDVAAAGITGSLPVRFTVTNTGTKATRLHVTGFSETPSRMMLPGGGGLVTLVDSDPATGTLSVEIPVGTTFDANVVHDPTWTSVVTTSPNPVPIGAGLTVDLDGPPTSTHGYLVVSIQEILTPVGAIQMTAYPAPPVLIYYLPLDPNGDLQLNQTVPNDVSLQGIRFPTQMVTTDSGGALESVSNLWGLYVQ